MANKIGRKKKKPAQVRYAQTGQRARNKAKKIERDNARAGRPTNRKRIGWLRKSAGLPDRRWETLRAAGITPARNSERKYRIDLMGQERRTDNGEAMAAIKPDAPTGDAA